MATINSLRPLNIPTGSENVVIENDDNNYRMAYKPVITYSIDLTGTTYNTMAEAIGALLDAIRARYGDLIDYDVQAYASITDWLNGLTIKASSIKAGTYVIWSGTAYSQTHGVYAFARWDTIGGAAYAVRVSELGANLA